MQENRVTLVSILAMVLAWLAIATTGVLAETVVFQERFEDTEMSGWEPGTSNKTISGWKVNNYRRALGMKFVDGGKERGKVFRIEGASGDVAFNMLSPSFSIKGGAKYIIRMMARHNYNASKLQGGGDSGTYMEWYDENGKRLSRTRIRGFDGPNESWHRDEVRNLASPAGAKTARIRIGVNYPFLGPRVYWEMDDIEVLGERGTPKQETSKISPVADTSPDAVGDNLLANGIFAQSGMSWSLQDGVTVIPGTKETAYVKAPCGDMVARQRVIDVQDIAGKTYVVSVLAKGEDQVKAGVLITYYNKAGKNNCTAGFPTKFDVSGEFKRYRFSWTAPQDAVKMNCFFLMRYGSGTVYYGDVSLAQAGIKKEKETVEEPKGIVKQIVLHSAESPNLKIESDGQTSILEAKETRRDGKMCTRIEAEFPGTWNKVLLKFKKPVSILQPWGSLSVDVHGDPSLTSSLKMMAVLVDGGGKTHTATLSWNLKFGYWLTLALPLSAKTEKFPEGGYMKPPILLDRIEVISRTPSKNTFYIGDIKLDPSRTRLIYHTYDRSWISPDLPFAPLEFSLQYDFSHGKKPLYLEIILDLPKEVNLEDCRVNTGLFNLKDYGLRVETEEHLRDGKSYVKHSILAPVILEKVLPHAHQLGCQNVLFHLSTDAKEGVFNSFYQVRYGNAETPEKCLPLQVLRLEPTAPPEKLRVMSGCRIFNGLEYASFFGINEDYTGDWFDALLTDVFRSKGLFAIGIDGTRIGQRFPCFNIKEALPLLTEQYKKALDSGIRKFVFDDEYNVYTGGHLRCFCPKCVAGFKTFLKQHEPDVKYIDPHTFESNPSPHPDLHQAWVNFGIFMYLQAGKVLRKETEDYLESKGVSKDKLIFYNDGLYIYTTDKPYIVRSFGEVFDWYGEQFYIDCYGQFHRSPRLAGDRAAAINKAIWESGSKMKQVPVLSWGLTYWMGTESDLVPHELVKYQIYEASAAGFAGFFMYGNVDLMDMKCLAEAVRAIKPVEELIMEGRPSNALTVQRGEANLRALEYKGNILVVVSQYFRDKLPQEVVIKMKDAVKGTASVIDLETGKEIGRINSTKTTFQISLNEGNRARLFLVKAGRM